MQTSHSRQVSREMVPIDVVMESNEENLVSSVTEMRREQVNEDKTVCHQFSPDVLDTYMNMSQSENTYF